MNILTRWLRSYLPELPSVSDRQLAEDLTLRGIAVEGEFPAPCGGALFEMDITTNRVDAMNHYGVAREVAAIYNVPLAPRPETAPLAETVPGEGFPVRIAADAEALSGRFTARVIRGVHVRPSVGVLATYFAALGQSPISGPVDATNFGWLAMGQPTHVFDLDTLEGGIVVRRAQAGETLRLLDGTERTLVTDDLVVADERKALGLAGVMGGWDSRVTENTRNILVEAAWFDPATVRASSRRHGLHTDASHRFERGADFAAAPLANHLVTRLVIEQAGGEIAGPLVDIIVPAMAARTAQRPPVRLRVAEVQRLLGTTLDDLAAGSTGSLSAALVEQYLHALGCTLTPGELGVYSVTLPSWRLDLEREIDLIEEVARVYGYNRFADTLPSFAGGVVQVAHIAQERAIRETLLALGYSETISSTFLSAEEAAAFGNPAAGAVAMGNPLSEEAGMLRPSLAAAMAGMLAKNLNRGATDVRLFELGTVFTGSQTTVAEHTGLSIGASGGAAANALHSPADALFYSVKGSLETLLGRFRGAVTFAPGPLPAWIAPGRGAVALLDGQPVAAFGELSPAESTRRKLRQVCAVAEVNAQRLLETPLRAPAVGELSRFQAAVRDLSFVLPDRVRWNDIANAIASLNLPNLQHTEPLEIFRDRTGKAVPQGSYSLLVHLVFQSAERTLTEDELAGWSASVVAALTTLGGTQRAPE